MQGMLGWKRRRPRWSCAFDGGWHDAWFGAAESAEPAACVAGTGQLLSSLQEAAEQLQVFAPPKPQGQSAEVLAVAFSAVADAVILACRAAECWDGE